MDASADYQAATTTAACFDLTGRTLIEITGPERQTFLHNYCTQDIKRLQPSDVREAFLANIKGRVVAHAHVWADTESLWLDADPGQAQTIIDHLARYALICDVELHDRTQTHAYFFVTGPKAPDSLEQLGFDVARLQPGTHETRPLAGSSLRIVRSDLLGDPGYTLVVACDSRDELVNRLGESITVGDEATYEALRIAALYPRYGVDISDENLAQEVSRTKQAVSFTKGCYLGQEPIARIDSMGHVNRELCGVECAPGTPLPAGATVVYDGNEVGRVTSSATIPSTGAVIGLAVIRNEANADGTEVQLVAGDQDASARIFRRPRRS